MQAIVLASLSLSFFGLAAPSPAAGDPTDLVVLREASLLDTHGKEVQLGDLFESGKPLVLAYTGVGCPISGKYAPRLARLQARFGESGVRFIGINANPQDSLDAIESERVELGLTFPVLKDFRQELTRLLDARTTTEVFVFDSSGRRCYRGAVDDQYSLGASRPSPTANYLVLALESLATEAELEIEHTEAPGCLLTMLPEEEHAESVTWSGDIAAIFSQNCESCHRPGQVGPFSLQTYRKARGWGEMIASVVEEGRMPPWNADERFDDHFTNERRLHTEDREKILRWLADGMPRGNPDEDPEPRVWSDDWRIGEPDVVFEMERFLTHGGDTIPEEGYRVPREGTVEYQYFTCETNFPEDRWIRAMEVRPGAADVVHHVLIGVHDFRKGPFGGANALIEYLAVAVPGDTPSIYPEGYAKLLPAGSSLVFQLHYTPNGKERFDRSSIGLIFAEEEPFFEVISEAIVNQRFQIPAGATNYEIRAKKRLKEDTGIISFFPHMHTRGKDFQYIAHYPDGSEEELLFTDYDFNWQESYIYEDPKPLPEGTVIECVAHYDNSAGNPNNPDPEKAVSWGDQTWEEMFVGYYDYVVPRD